MTRLRDATSDELPPDVRMWRGLLAVFEFIDEQPDAWALLSPHGPAAGGQLAAGAARIREEITALLARLLRDAAVAEGGGVLGKGGGDGRRDRLRGMARRANAVAVQDDGKIVVVGDAFGEGFFALPLVDEIMTAGLTARQLENEIETRLQSGGYLVDPQVSIEVLNYRPFYIIGEVNNPGSYQYVNGMTVINAVALAGGFSYRAGEDVTTAALDLDVFVASLEGYQSGLGRDLTGDE